MPTPWYLDDPVLDLLAVIAAAGLTTSTFTEHGETRERFTDEPLYSSLVAWHDVAAQTDWRNASVRVRPESVAAAVTGIRLQGYHWNDADEQLIPLRNEISAALEARCMAEAA
ncbi:hypothetical protein [Sphingomonas turrisvirgatae]|uniref:Uncharacterized protein n=1 Tax=Sphingomonas turrisvirgatae TaxID=1888892 RepID=A0A1E3LZW9_9SPHN|nr:hypothetical protein [Sphingomonas turrisvirgatae]ODP39284.1 hypothetical protein BFL28_10750 [Sphingomonas turrisvirgatae]